MAHHFSRLAAGLLSALMLTLSGCSKPPSDTPPPETAGPPAAPVAQPPPRQIIRTSWNFDSGRDECVAVAAAGATSLRVTIRRNAPIRLVVSLAPQFEPRLAGRPAISLRFNGPSGRWQASAQQIGNRQITATLGSEDTALSRLLVLLNGGALDVGTSEQFLLSLAVAPSDTQGKLWFDCARDKMI